MPLTEEQITEITERLYRYATERDRPNLDWELLGAKIALDAISVIAELRASQAEARRLRERLASLGVAWHDTVHMSEINPDIEFAHCPKWSCREASAALAPAPEGT